MYRFWFLYYGLVTCNTFVAAAQSAHTDHDSDFAYQLATMKNTMEVLSDQWEKWNTLFITSLEPRITTSASTLSSIDSNIHNLQERAHVWDTFQLHVAAWNEQLISVDRKMDILNKGIEQLTLIETKMNTLLSGDFKLDKVIKITTSVLEAVVDIESGLKPKQYCKSSKDSLFEEFAARGILSSLKLIERKVDQLFSTRKSENGIKFSTDEPVMKYVISKSMENSINDISSKVDIIFDTIYKGNEKDYSDDYVDAKNVDNEGSGSSPNKYNFQNFSNYRDNSSLLHSHKFCKVIDQDLKNINDKVRNIEDSMSSLVRYNQLHFPNTSLNSIDKKDLVDFLNDDSKTLSDNQTRNLNLILDFHGEKISWSSILNSLCKKCFPTLPQYPAPSTSPKSTRNPPNQLPNSNTQAEDNYLTLKYHVGKTRNLFEDEREPKIVNKISCNELDHDSTNGIYTFKGGLENHANERFFNKQYCEIRESGIWTVIQRRDNYTIQQDFNVSWQDYKLGFGDLQKDFWIGNNYLSRLSNTSNLVLRIELEDFEGNRVWAEYQHFKVAGEDQQFRLQVHGYSGNATDAFSTHSGTKFSTYDRKNDEAPECCPCSVSYGGGWWFNRCFESNLNGLYYKKPFENEYFRGIIWEHWLGNYSLKKSLMMVKPISTKSLNVRSNIHSVEDP